MLRAVLFDVDFTLFRPGPELGPDGYRRVGERHGLVLDPARYAQARLDSIAALAGERDLVHDEEVWIAFTEQIVLGMGGEPAGARACAVDMVREWERHENFSLYEDALPVLEELRRHRIKIGLVTNGQRDLDEFVAHHSLEVDAMVGSKAHGKSKPHPSIFVAALADLGASPGGSVMVGDSTRTTSRARGRSGCGRSCWTATASTPRRRSESTRSSRCRPRSDSRPSVA